MKKLLLSSIFACAMATAAQAAVILTNPITDTNPSASNPFTIGQTFDPNITVTGIGRGVGILANAGSNRYNATSFNTPSFDPDAYFTFTLDANEGFEIDYTDFVYTGQASGTGPISFAFRSSIDGFTADIGTPTATGATISLADASFQNLVGATEFRLYGFGATSAAGTFSVNDFTFNADVVAVPEPSTYAMLVGGAGLMFYVIRRKRASAL